MGSPIGTLHPELLSEIFKYVVLSGPLAFRANPRLLSAILLSLVSRTWCAVAHSTPSLWSSLGLSIYYTARAYPRMSLVERWVERSASYPLHLVMDVRDIERNEEDGDRLVQLISKNRERIRSLRILCDPGAKVWGVLNKEAEESDTTGGVPNLKLEELVVRVSEIENEGAEIKIPYSKRLRELDLDLGRATSIFPSGPGRQFENLRSLTIESTSTRSETNRVLELLEGCSDTLESFTWKAVVLPHPSTSTRRQITLPSLTTLRVKTYTPPIHFFALLTLPALTSLDIFVSPGCELRLISYPGLLSRSLSPQTGKTKLEEIYVRLFSDLRPDEVLKILKVSPGLRSCIFTDPLTLELVLALGDPSLAPLLEHMEFGPFQFGEADGEGVNTDLIRIADALEKLVLLRWGGPSGNGKGLGALKSFRVNHVRDVRAVERAILACPGLTACAKEGFDLEFVSI